jgi:hypothetical protein
LAYWKCTPEKLVANAEQYEYVLEQLATMEEEGGLWNWVKEQWYDYKEEKESLEHFFADCRDANEIREGVEELHYIVTNWDEIEKLYSQVSQRISAYLNTLEKTDNIGRYERGRLIVPVVSTALTLGGTAATKIEEIKNILKSLRTVSEGSWKKVTEGFGKLLTKKVVRENWNGFANIFKATADEVAEAATKIKSHRVTVGAGTKGNYGYLEGTINNSIVDNKIWRSGQALESEPRIFTAIEVEGAGGKTWLRTTDSEYKMLNKLASDLKAKTGAIYPSITGELKVVSENPYCASCQGIIQQFNKMFPNVKLILVDGAK